MQWFTWLALLAGVLPLIFMAIGYWFITRAQRAADEAASSPGPASPVETTPGRRAPRREDPTPHGAELP